MKKIVLIDDNKANQRVAYGAAFVDEGVYSDVLYHVEKLNTMSDLSFLNEAVCVMMHDSLEDFIYDGFDSSSHKVKDKIEEFIQTKGIPYVLFSDGHDITAEWREETPNVVYSIKKSEFYRHLNDFILYYKETGSIDMRVIAYGKKYLKTLVKKWCQCVLAGITALGDSDVVKLSMIDRKSFHNIIENSQPIIGTSFDEVMSLIEDEEIHAKRLRKNINNILSDFIQYGENYSIWE